MPAFADQGPPVAGGYPAAPGHGVPAQPGGYAAAAEAPAGPPIGRLLRRKWFLLLVGLAAGVAGGYYHFTKQEPVYRSTAEVTVSYRQTALPVEADTAGRPQGGAYDVLDDLLHRLMTPPLIARAIQEHGLSDLPRFRGGGSPVLTILGGLSGERVDGTRVLRLTYSGRSPEETKAVLDAVVSTFVESVKDDEQSVIQEAITMFTKANTQVRGELEEAEKKYREFQLQSPLVRGADGVSLNPYAADLLKVDAMRDEFRLELAALNGELDSIRRSLAVGGRREALAMMASLSRREAGNAGRDIEMPTELTFDEANLDLLLELEEAREKYGANHPELKRLESRYEKLTSIMKRRAGLTDEGGAPVSFLDLYVQAREEYRRKLESQIASLNEDYARTKEKADALRDAELTEQDLRSWRDRHASTYEVLVDRVAQLDLLKDADRLRAAELVPAGPGVLTPVELIRSLGAGGAFGFAIAFGLAYLLEQGDKSFKGPDEIRAEFGLPLLGHVPEIPAKVLKRTRKDASPLDPSLLTVHRPKSRLAESYRAVRAGLLFGGRSGVRVIQVTSADPGDGKSTLAANLAVSLGRSGKKTVLVDCDMRRPRVGRLFGLTKDGVCVTEAIADPDRVDEAAVDVGVDGLRVLPCLRKPEHPAELLSSQAFEEFVEVLRQKFDFVVLDSPPVLAVSDPAATAPAADGVILVTRLSKRTRRKVRESLDTLERAGANVVGLVINGIEPGGEYTRGVESGYYGGGYGGGYGGRRGAYYSEEPGSEDTPPAPAKAAKGGRSGTAAGRVNGHRLSV